MEYEKSYWDKRYAEGGNSGYGSYGDQLAKKLNWLRGLDVYSISEIGCGDFNFGKSVIELFPGSKYYGYDISRVIIAQNQAKYPEQVFTSSPVLPQSDLLLCVDVLFHII